MVKIAFRAALALGMLVFVPLAWIPAVWQSNLPRDTAIEIGMLLVIVVLDSLMNVLMALKERSEQ